tara:strand:- start:2591 stop:2827 length:237 start_codon:yes stop_codon:yes gene_type:complete
MARGMMTEEEMLAQELKKQPKMQMADAPMMTLKDLVGMMPAEQIEGYIGSLVRSKNDMEKIQGLMLMREFEQIGKDIF